MRVLLYTMEGERRRFVVRQDSGKYDGFSAIFRLIKSDSQYPNLEVVCGLFVRTPTYKNKSICISTTRQIENVSYAEFRRLLKDIVERRYPRMTIEPEVPILAYLFYDVKPSIKGVYQLVEKAYNEQNWDIVDGIGFHVILSFN